MGVPAKLNKAVHNRAVELLSVFSISVLVVSDRAASAPQVTGGYFVRKKPTQRMDCRRS
jgi:hypothetical protein